MQNKHKLVEGKIKDIYLTAYESKNFREFVATMKKSYYELFDSKIVDKSIGWLNQIFDDANNPGKEESTIKLSSLIKESAVLESEVNTLQKIADASDWYSSEWFDDNEDYTNAKILLQKGFIKQRTSGHLVFYKITPAGFKYI